MTDPRWYEGSRSADGGDRGGSSCRARACGREGHGGGGKRGARRFRPQSSSLEGPEGDAAAAEGAGPCRRALPGEPAKEHGGRANRLSEPHRAASGRSTRQGGPGADCSSGRNRRPFLNLALFSPMPRAIAEDNPPPPVAPVDEVAAHLECRPHGGALRAEVVALRRTAWMNRNRPGAFRPELGRESGFSSRSR